MSLELMPTHIVNELQEANIFKYGVGITCCVCLAHTTLMTLRITACGHKYCQNCITSVGPTCAYCRAPDGVARASTETDETTDNESEYEDSASVEEFLRDCSRYAWHATMSSDGTISGTQVQLAPAPFPRRSDKYDKLYDTRDALSKLKKYYTTNNDVYLAQFKRVKATLEPVNVYDWPDFQQQLNGYYPPIPTFIWNLYAAAALKLRNDDYICVDSVIIFVNRKFLQMFDNLPSYENPICGCGHGQPHRCPINQNRCYAGYKYNIQPIPGIDMNYMLAVTNPQMYMPSISMDTVRKIESKFNFCLRLNKKLKVWGRCHSSLQGKLSR